MYLTLETEKEKETKLQASAPHETVETIKTGHLAASFSVCCSAFRVACLQMSTVRDTASKHTDTSET